MTDIIDTVVDNIMGKKHIVLDASILSTLMACPRLADFQYNLSLRQISGKSNSLECGSIVHKFMEVYYGSMIKGINKTEALGFGMAAAQLYINGCKYCSDFTPTEAEPKPSCGHTIDEYPGVKNTPQESIAPGSNGGARIGWAWVLSTCEQYHDHYRNDHWVPLEVERVKSEILYEDDEVRILWKAKLDWTADTNQGIYPIDHKTMKQRRDTVSMNNQFIGQCLIMKTRGMFLNKIGFQTTLKPEEKFSRYLVNYSAERLLEWQSETLPYYGKLLLMYSETGHFPPNFASCEGKYGNCSFLKVCESNPDMRESEIKKLFYVGPEWNPTNEDE